LTARVGDHCILRKKYEQDDKKSLLPVAHVVKAVEFLRKTNITLTGYVLSDRMNIYSQERRIMI
jgi:hypothetical protein